MTVAPAPAEHPRARPGPRAPAVLLLPGPQRGGQPRGAGARGARGPARDRRTVRDHRRRRRLEGPDARDRRAARRRAPGRRAGRPPRGQPRLRRRPAVGLRGVPLRAPRVHRRRPPVPGRRPGPADGPPRPGRPPGRGRGLPDQARRPRDPRRLRAHLQARQPDLLRPQGQGRRLRVQAVPARGARGGPGRVGRRVLLGRAADQDPGGGPQRGPGRHPALPADGRLADRRQAVGDLARRQGLLGPAAADVGEPRAGGPARPADPGRRTGHGAATASSSTGLRAGRPRGPAS